MIEDLIPECREFTMVEELWPIKKYEGNRPVWDCRNWLVGALQCEILDHVKQYNHPYVLTLSEEPIWTQVGYENRRDKRSTLSMQKLSPLEISMIITPFIKKWYNVYQDEKAKCIKISRKQIPDLKPLELPQDLMRGEWGKSRLDEIWTEEEKSATRYMQALLMHNGFTVVRKRDNTDTSVKFTIHLAVGGPTVEAEIKAISYGKEFAAAYQALVEMDIETMEAAKYSAHLLDSDALRTAHEAAAWIVSLVCNVNKNIEAYAEKNRNNNDR